MAEPKNAKKKVDDLVKDMKGKAAKAEAETRSMLSTLLIAGGVFLVAVLGYMYVTQKGLFASRLGTAPAAAEIMKPGPLPDIVMGDPNAKVTIIEYASLTCPHCGAFHTSILPELKKKYIDTGKAKLILRGLPLNEVDLAAQMLSRCLPGDKYYAFTGAVFEGQRAWLTGDVEQGLKSFARQAGFTEESYKACLDNAKIRDALIDSAKIAGDKFGVESTPTFFINGKRLEADRFDLAAFDKALAPLVN